MDGVHLHSPYDIMDRRGGRSRRMHRVIFTELYRTPQPAFGIALALGDGIKAWCKLEIASFTQVRATGVHTSAAGFVPGLFTVRTSPGSPPTRCVACAEVCGDWMILLEDERARSFDFP